MHSCASRPRGFTLVELLIVVSILGILAAIVIPKFTVATDQARSAGALSQLTGARKQIEIWKLDHGSYPTLSQIQRGSSDWEVFTSKTDADGTTNATGNFGPYFASPPMNSFTGNSLVVAAGAPVAGAGWTYSETTGFLKVILPATLVPVPTEFGANDYEQVGSSPD